MFGNDYRDAPRYRLCIFMMFQWCGEHVLSEPMYSLRLAMILGTRNMSVHSLIVCLRFG